MTIKATDYQCVIFDLDGTLVDSAHDLLATLNVLFSKRGHREIKLEEVKTVIGHGAKAMIRDAGALTGLSLSETEVEELFLEYLEYYGANLAVHTRPLKGAVEVLEACQKAGIAMAVCTNKLESLSLKLLDELDLAKFFQTVIASDTLSTMKPDPAGVNAILKAANCPPEKALFVGDSETDLKAARNAGVTCVLVDVGYTKVPVRELDPDGIINTLDELL